MELRLFRRSSSSSKKWEYSFFIIIYNLLRRVKRRANAYNYFDFYWNLFQLPHFFLNFYNFGTLSSNNKKTGSLQTCQIINILRSTMDNVYGSGCAVTNEILSSLDAASLFSLFFYIIMHYYTYLSPSSSSSSAIKLTQTEKLMKWVREKNWLY